MYHWSKMLNIRPQWKIFFELPYIVLNAKYQLNIIFKPMVAHIYFLFFFSATAAILVMLNFCGLGGGVFLFIEVNKNQHQLVHINNNNNKSNSSTPSPIQCSIRDHSVSRIIPKSHFKVSTEKSFTIDPNLVWRGSERRGTCFYCCCNIWSPAHGSKIW